MKDELIKLINQFRDARDWRQFHNEKDLAISISIEAAELLENYQWLSPEEASKKNLDGIKDEIADICIYLTMLADNLGLSIDELIRNKIKKNEEKYPVEKAKGKSDKYTQYQ